jgi:hypothetical protein
MRWVIGSQPIILRQDMRDLIDLGVGHLKTVHDEQADDQPNYPVYINEPIVIASLSSSFEKHVWTNRKAWISNYLGVFPSKASFGDAFVEAILFVMMDKFGGKSTALGDVFRFGKSSSLGLRKVTLVSLMRIGDIMKCCDVSWNSGSSPRLGFKANSPEEVLRFFRDPLGIAFLFPDIHMGPDMIGFFRDTKTQELIIFLIQAKARPVLDSKSWLSAIQSVNPDFFYTMIVRVACLTFIMHHRSSRDIARWRKDQIRSSFIPNPFGGCEKSHRGYARARKLFAGC